MARDFKVKRYGVDLDRKCKQRTRLAILTVLGMVVAGAIGWFFYEPIYRAIIDFCIPSFEGNTSISTSQPENTPPISSAHQEEQPTGDFSGLPERTAYLPVSLLREELSTHLSNLKEQGIQGVVIELKDITGRVLYKSDITQVIDNRTQSENPYNLEKVVMAIRQAGLKPIGFLWAFQDSTAPIRMLQGAVKYNNTSINWIDDFLEAGGKPWLNPNSAEAQQYILSLIEEGAAHGLEAILLEGVQFPRGAALNMATYGVNGVLDKSKILSDFIILAKETGEKQECEVWPIISLVGAAGADPVPYGAHPENILAAAGRGVLDVRPEQFGTGIQTSTLSLTLPVLEPYATIQAGLSAAPKALYAVEQGKLAAMVQAHTSTILPQNANRPYGVPEIANQVRAVQEVGIDKIFYYNPLGEYSLKNE